MEIYTVLSLLTAVSTAFMCGALLIVGMMIKMTKAQMAFDQKQLKRSVTEFDEITKRASEASISMGTGLADLESRVVALDERLSILQGTATGTGAGNSLPWQKTTMMNRQV